MEYEDCRIEFPCPECQQKFPVALRWLFQGAEFVCPVCGATNPEDELTEISQAFKELEIELINLRQKLNNENEDYKAFS